MRLTAALVLVGLSLSACQGIGGRTDLSSELRAQRQVSVHGRVTLLCPVPKNAANAAVQLFLAEQLLAETVTAPDGRFDLSVSEPDPGPAAPRKELSLVTTAGRVTLVRVTANNYEQDLSLPCPQQPP